MKILLSSETTGNTKVFLSSQKITTLENTFLKHNERLPKRVEMLENFEFRKPFGHYKVQKYLLKFSGNGYQMTIVREFKE